MTSVLDPGIVAIGDTTIAVRAARDIERFRTTVVCDGAPGRVVAVQWWQAVPSYTVEFVPGGLAGATVTVHGLRLTDVLFE